MLIIVDHVALIFIILNRVAVFACGVQDNKRSFAHHTVLCPNVLWLTLQTFKKSKFGPRFSKLALFLAMTCCNH